MREGLTCPFSVGRSIPFCFIFSHQGRGGVAGRGFRLLGDSPRHAREMDCREAVRRSFCCHHSISSFLLPSLSIGWPRLRTSSSFLSSSSAFGLLLACFPPPPGCLLCVPPRRCSTLVARVVDDAVHYRSGICCLAKCHVLTSNEERPYAGAVVPPLLLSRVALCARARLCVILSSLLFSSLFLFCVFLLTKPKKENRPTKKQHARRAAAHTTAASESSHIRYLFLYLASHLQAEWRWLSSSGHSSLSPPLE